MQQDQEFVEYVVRAIVDNPEAVETDRTVDEMGVLITLSVSPDDMGKIIGKEGRTAKALRTLLRVLGAKNNARVNLKIMEPDGGEARVREESSPQEPAEPEKSSEKSDEKAKAEEPETENATEIL